MHGHCDKQPQNTVLLSILVGGGGIKTECVFSAVFARHTGQCNQNATGSEHRLRSGSDEDSVSRQPGSQSGVTAEICSHGLVQNCQYPAAFSSVCHGLFCDLCIF